MVIPPKDGYGEAGQPQAGIKGTDTLVFVVDVIASYPKSGVPQKNTPVGHASRRSADRHRRDRRRAGHHCPEGRPRRRRSSSSDYVLEGDGPGGQADGQLASCSTTRVLWDGGKTFDSTYDHGQPTFPLSQVRQGPAERLPARRSAARSSCSWRPAGSRVLLTLPAQTRDIAADSTLVFAVDILTSL